MNAGPANVGRLHLRTVDPEHDHATATAAESLPGATVFHSAAWCRLLHDCYGFRTRLFVAEADDGRVLAAVPVTELPCWPRGARGVSLPFADFCPMVHGRAEARDFLHSAIARHALERGWRHWELRGDGAPEGASPSTLFHGHVLRLDHSDGDFPPAAVPSVRRAVRKAVNSRVSIEISRDEAALRRFHELYCRTRRRHGTPPAPWRFLAAVGRELITPGQGFVALARRGGVDLAGAVFLRHGPRALYKYGASDPDNHSFRPNHLLMARSVARLVREGCVELHLGRTSLGAEGLRRYKLSWGAVEHIISYTRLDPVGGRFLSAPDRTRTWPTRFFRRLPTPLLRAVGAILHPRLA